MRHRLKGRRLSRSTPHRKALLANLATSLIEHGGINTTDAKAKELRPYIEKLVTLAKKGDLNSRRRAIQIIHNKDAVKRLFDDWAPQFQTRTDENGGEKDWNGGYTRILKLGRRKGDAAEISMIEFVAGVQSVADSADEVVEEPAEVQAEEVEAAE
jgi:large subunit ribosomal protein L17